jgi:hypothetical protein
MLKHNLHLRPLADSERMLTIRQALAGGGEQVVDIRPRIEGLVASWQCDRFGCSLRAFLLYAQWGDWNERQPGVVVAGEDVLLAVGLYRRQGGWHLHVVCPQGGQRVPRARSLSRQLLGAGLVDRIYVMCGTWDRPRNNFRRC